MQSDPTPITLNPDSEIAHRLKEAASLHRPILVAIDDVIYSVAADEDTAVPLPVPTTEEATATIAAIEQVSGSWAGLIDAEEFKAYIQQRCKTANRPSIEL